MKQPDIHRLLELQKLLLQFSQVERVIDREHIAGFVRENDSEHSYNLALTAWFLAGHFPELDRDEVIRIALAHDLVEVHAGDTFVYGPQEHLDTKQAREQAALKQLADEWKDFPDAIKAIRAYKAKSSAEAKFVYALDKVMPILIIYLGEGHTWKKENITLEQLKGLKKEQVAISPEIRPYYEQLIVLLTDQPELFT